VARDWSTGRNWPRRDSRTSSHKQNIATIGALAAALAMTTPVLAQTNNADLPPNAKAGECWARIVIPVQFRTIIE